MMAHLVTPTCWIEISRAALHHNLCEIRKLVGPTVQIFPCVKASAYGHGVVSVEKVMAAVGADGFSVAEFAEAWRLRTQGVRQPIQIMSPLPDDYIQAAAGADLWVWVHDLADAHRVVEKLAGCKKCLKVVVKVDTGMGRLGVHLAELAELLRFLKQSHSLQVVSVATHFATSDLGDELFTVQQESFARVQCLTTAIMGRDKISFQSANSAAILRSVQTHGDIVRPGLAIYGYWPATALYSLADANHLKLEPALSWKSRILQVKRLAAGANVGYGGKTSVAKATQVATIPVGYALGLDHRLSKQGAVLIGGKRAALLGNVCMNVTMVDVSELDHVQVGDEVVIIGKQGDITQSAADLAQGMGAMVYEVLVQLSPFIERRLID